MWTQRDQLQAYQFLRRRLVSAIQTGDANHPVSPSRRLVLGYAVGTVCALVAVAGFGIYGVMRPGAGQQWRNAGQVVIEKESGARYVLMADGLLHPVLNYASARLLAGGDGRATATVSARSLAGVPRGAPLGIPDAPDSLPAPGRLLAGPWTVCSGTAADQPAQQKPATTVLLGVPVTGGGQPIGDQDAVVVSDENGTRFAVFAGRRWKLRDTAADALGYREAQPVPVTAAWLNAVPVASDLQPVVVDGSGSPGQQVGQLSTLVGQVLFVDNLGGDRRYFVVRAGGLDPVSEIEATLILNSQANRPAYPGRPQREIQVSAADVAGRTTDVPAADAYPARIPKPLAPGGRKVVCAASDGSERAGIWLVGGMPLPAGARALPASGTATNALTADGIFVPPGAGAVVRGRQSPDAQAGTVFLITDRGTRYPLGGADAVRALGYGGVTPTPVASTLLSLFPTGAALDTASAQVVTSR